MVFKIAYIGFLSRIKGVEQLYYVIEALKYDDVEFHIFGDIERTKFTKDHQFSCYMHGIYNGIDELKIFINKYGIECAILPSICNETYSYTLSECWLCGLPVIGTVYGAIGERIKTCNGGWIIDPYDVDSVVNLIRHLINNRHEIERYKEHVNNIQLKSVQEMKLEYMRVYNDIRKYV